MRRARRSTELVCGAGRQDGEEYGVKKPVFVDLGTQQKLFYGNFGEQQIGGGFPGSDDCDNADVVYQAADIIKDYNQIEKKLISVL